jgi:hypothetical protein
MPLIGPRVVLPDWSVGTPEQAEAMRLERERLLGSQYFLVRISGQWDRWRCRNCGGKHPYLTLRCIEQPFSGLTGGLYAVWHHVGANGILPTLSPAQRAKFDRLAGIFAGVDLSRSHPRTAQAMGVAERDAELGAIALGILEPLSRASAQALVKRINVALKPPLVVPGLES